MLYLLFLFGLSETSGQLNDRLPKYNDRDVIGYGMSYCPSGYVRCPDGSCKLNRPLELCPGEKCEAQTGFYYTECDDGKRCYTMYDRCDGQYQCDDGSDEHGCTVSDCSFPFPRKYCPMDRLCVPKDTDCPSLQDFACPNQKPMRCKDYSGCYSSDQVCDGVSDCSDNTDEYCQIPTIETPITSDLTRSVTTLLGILGCIPIFAIFVFLHKYCENKIMTYKPRVLQTTSNMPTMQNRSRSTAHSSGVDPAVQEPIAVRPLLRPPAICRPVSIHTNMSTVPVHHTSAPQYSQIVPSDTSYSLGAPPPYSLCAARSAPIFMDMPPSYEEAIAQSTVRVQQQTSCDSEGSLLIRLHF